MPIWLFQSHAGSIEALIILLVFLSIVGFNPTLVRLRPLGKLLLGAIYIVFQSHAGSIEARPRGAKTSAFLQFQSHAGSIEARIRFSILWADPPVSIPRWFD